MANAFIIGQGNGGGVATVTIAAVGLNGSPAPLSSIEIGFINASGNEVGVSATNPLPITGTITATNPSVGATGVAAPAFATEIGIIDASGHLVGSSASNPVRIDPTGTTVQPVSGTITALQGTSPWVVSGSITAAITGQSAPDTPLVGNPVTISGVDAAGNVQELPVADNGTTAPSQILVVGGVTNSGLVQPFALAAGVGIGIVETLINSTGTDGATNITGFFIDAGGVTRSVGMYPSIFNGTTWDRQRTVQIGNNVAPTGIAASGAYGQFNTVLPTISSGNYTSLQTDSSGRLLVASIAGTNAENLIQVAGVTLGATAVTNFGTAPAAAAVPGVNASIFAGTTGITATGSSLNTNITNTVPVTLISTTVTNTVAENLTQVAGVVLGATAVTAFGTAPAAANVPGVNSSIFAGTTGITATGSSLNVNITNAAGPFTIAGNKSNNSVAPGATNLGVLPAIANAATQAWTEGNQVLLSVDLSGRQRIRGTLTPNNAAPGSDGQMALTTIASAAAPTYTEGDLVLASVDLGGATRIVGTRTNNNAAPSFEVGVIPALANAASPAWTEGNQVLLSVDLTGRQRVRGTLTNNNAAPTADLIEVMPAIATTAAPSYTTGDAVMLSTDLTGNLRVTPTAIGTLTNNNAAPGTINLGVLPALANAAAPAWTEGNQVLLSVDLSGRQRMQGQVAADAAFTGNPMVVAGVDAGGLVQELPVADKGATAPSQTLMVGGFDSINGNIQPLLVDQHGKLSLTDSAVGADATANTIGFLIDRNAAADTGLAVFPLLFNGATWDLVRSATIGNAVVATGIAAAASYGQYNTAAPAPATGRYSALQTDYAGSLFTKPIRRSTTVAKATTISATGATSVLAAQAAGIFADISNLVITVVPLAGAVVDVPFTVTLSDGTATYIFDMDTGQTGSATVGGSGPTGVNINFNPPLPATTAATAWTINESSAQTIHVTVVAVLQKAS